MKFKNFDNYKKKDKPSQPVEEISADEQSVQPVGVIDEEPI